MIRLRIGLAVQREQRLGFFIVNESHEARPIMAKRTFTSSAKLPRGERARRTFPFQNQTSGAGMDAMDTSVASLCKGRFIRLQCYFEDIVVKDLPMFEEEFFERHADKTDRALMHLFVVTLLQPLLKDNIPPPSMGKISWNEIVVDEVADMPITMLVVNCQERLLSSFVNTTVTGRIGVQTLPLVLFSSVPRLVKFKKDIVINLSDNDLLDVDLPYIVEIGAKISSENPDYSVQKIIFNLSHNRLFYADDAILSLLRQPCTKRVDITFNALASISRRDFFQSLNPVDKEHVETKLVFIPEQSMGSPEAPSRGWHQLIPPGLDVNRVVATHTTHWLSMHDA